jgi:phosphoribosylglycinamide formyltransferase-1
LEKTKHTDPINLAIFASGNGSNALNIINYFEEREDIRVKKIFCNKKEAPVIGKAKAKGISSYIFTKSQLEEDNFILSQLKALGIDYIILAGFLLKIPKHIVQHFEHKIINIHPALLPKYGGKGMYGKHVHQAVVENKETKTGISIHFVNEHYDEGDIIFQEECEVLKTDTADDVARKIHKLEMTYFPRIIEQTIKGY